MKSASMLSEASSMGDAPSLTLPMLGEQTNDCLARAVVDLVAAKRALDGDGWSRQSAILGGSLPERLGTGPAPPSEVVRSVLPFIDWNVQGRAMAALIPVAQTIGMNCKWSRRTVPPEERDRLVAHLTDPQRAAHGDSEGSDTVLIRPFGIFVAAEGKNRVAFLASCGVEWMPSRVIEVDYPSAERLRIFKAADGCEDRMVCVLDNEHLLPLEAPTWSLPLLRAYGVRMEAWPSEFPGFEEVCAQLRARTKDVTGRLLPISLTELNEQLAHETSNPLPEAIIGHKLIQFYPRRLLPMLAIAFLLLITAEAWPAAWNVRDLFLGLGLGALGMASACTTLPIVALRREPHRALERSRRPPPHNPESPWSRWRRRK